MRLIYRAVCPRCWQTVSAEGVSQADAQVIADSHVCADGVASPCGLPTLHAVPGPGERTKLLEEQGRYS